MPSFAALSSQQRQQQQQQQYQRSVQQAGGAFSTPLVNGVAGKGQHQLSVPSSSFYSNSAARGKKRSASSGSTPSLFAQLKSTSSPASLLQHRGETKGTPAQHQQQGGSALSSEEPSAKRAKLEQNGAVDLRIATQRKPVRSPATGKSTSNRGGLSSNSSSSKKNRDGRLAISSQSSSGLSAFVQKYAALLSSRLWSGGSAHKSSYSSSPQASSRSGRRKHGRTAMHGGGAGPSGISGSLPRAAMNGSSTSKHRQPTTTLSPRERSYASEDGDDDEEAAAARWHAERQSNLWASSLARAAGGSVADDTSTTYARKKPIGLSDLEKKKKMERDQGYLAAIDLQAAQEQSYLASSLNGASRALQYGENDSSPPGSTSSSYSDYRRQVDAAKAALSPAFPSSGDATLRLVRSRDHEGALRRAASTSSLRLKGIDGIRRTMERTKDDFKLETVHFDRLRLEEKQRDEELDKAAEAAAAPKRRRIRNRLSAEDQKLVDAALRDSAFKSSMAGAEVIAKDLRRLQGKQWLNDEVITFYSVLLTNRSKAMVARRKEQGLPPRGDPDLLDVHVFNSFFWSSLDQGGYSRVRRWTAKKKDPIDVFAKDRIIVPINLGNAHWVCAAINPAQKRFEYYDSMGTPLPAVYRKLRAYMMDEHKDKKKGEPPLDLSDWEDYWDEDVPQQNNACDCGVFTCQFMETLSRRTEGFDFRQSNMPYLRNKIALEVMRQELIPEPFE